MRPTLDLRSTARARAAREKTLICSFTSSLVPMTKRTSFRGTLRTEPEASREPTSVPEQRYSMKSSSSSVVSNAILSFATFTKIIGIWGQSLKKRIQAKSSLHERNSAMMKSTLLL